MPGVHFVSVRVVISAAVLAGLSPVPTTVLALAGNLTTDVVVAVAGDKIIARRLGYVDRSR